VAAVAAGSTKLEQTYGIPTAPVSTYGFDNLAKDAYKAGRVPLPFIFTPHPVAGMSLEALYGYLEGNDPETGKHVIDEIIDALTKPVRLTKPEPESASPETVKAKTPPTLLKPDTEDNLQRLFYEKGWTDGLPIVLPTEERVKKMLTGTSASPDDAVVESFRMETREIVRYTVNNIAVIAVMAGARPEHFPVILAIASSGQPAIMGSTTAFSAMLLVNGPIRNEIGMNSGIGAFSPINMANSVIGRAWTLMDICHGGGKPRKSLWSSQGSNLSYNNMCVAENEEASPWEPFHVQKGFKTDESVVSIFRGWAVINSTGAAANRTLTEELNLELAVIPPLNSAATIIMDPSVARNLKENEGFNTKEDYCRWLSQNIKMTAGRYWKTDYIDMLVASEAYKGVEPYASWKKLPDDALIAPYFDPDRINLIVVGGETSPLWKASDFGHIGSISIDRWRASKSGDECVDGTCGVPDPDDPANYDKV
jgi:hypothetical protein